MKYQFQTGKFVTIPDIEIERSMTVLHISQEEAIQLWLEDNDYITNEQVEILTAKAKENKAVQHGAVNPDKPKSSTKRERKPDAEKENLIAILAETLISQGYSVNITNKSKLIEFTVGENHYKLDLIKQRPPKTS